MKLTVLCAAALAAFSFTAPAEARTCKQNVSEIINKIAPYSGAPEYKWRKLVRIGREALIESGCEPIGSGYDVAASGVRLDNMLYGGPDPNGY